jgi:RHS repeat-associated protein
MASESDQEGRRTYYTGSSAVKDNNSDRTYFHFNHRGDTIAVSDKDGNMLNEFSYEAYGTVTNQTGTTINPSIETTPNLFVGAYGIRYDGKTELSYMRMRWYSSKQLRFIGFDFLFGINRFDYAKNNPVRYIDPSGLEYQVPTNTWPIYNYDPDYLQASDAIWNEYLNRPKPEPGIFLYDPPQSWMNWAGTYATGIDASINYGAAFYGGGTIGAGAQLVSTPSGEADIFVYQQGGPMGGVGFGRGASFGAFYVSGYNREKFTGLTRTTTFQLFFLSISKFQSVGQEDPCGWGINLSQPASLSVSHTLQQSMTIEDFNNLLWHEYQNLTSQTISEDLIGFPSMFWSNAYNSLPHLDLMNNFYYWIRWMEYQNTYIGR